MAGHVPAILFMDVKEDTRDKPAYDELSEWHEDPKLDPCLRRDDGWGVEVVKASGAPAGGDVAFSYGLWRFHSSSGLDLRRQPC